MKIFVLVKNGYHWVRFFDNFMERNRYFYGQLAEDVKNEVGFEHIKTYSNKYCRLFVKRRDKVMDEIIRDDYSFIEITIADALNWQMAENKTAFVKQWIIDNA